MGADAPFFVKGYYNYYKAERSHTKRPFNSNAAGWNVTSSLSFLNMPSLRYSNKIRSTVLVFANRVKDNSWAGDRELLIMLGAVHTDLYDRRDIILRPDWGLLPEVQRRAGCT